jgi:catechol 2,3-dioxygenase-like lactoylglutathione lyase family enzyme
MVALATLWATVLDCADPEELAAFYQKVTGWDVTYRDDVYVYLGDGGPVQIGFQKVAGYQPAGWPDPAKHGHLDFRVADMDEAVEELVALGATKPELQPGDGKWIVMVDPAGHLFCITT